MRRYVCSKCGKPLPSPPPETNGWACDEIVNGIFCNGLPTQAPSIVQFDADDAEYIGDEQDGVYFQVAEGKDGWYMTAVVDCDSASFVDTLVGDDGPYPTQAEAKEAGRNAAMEWCMNNHVEVGE